MRARTHGVAGRTLKTIRASRSTLSVAFLLVAATSACTSGASKESEPQEQTARRVIPGITVLVRDSIDLLRGKRVGLVTNQTGVDETGRSTIDLLFAALPARGAQLAALFSPEHGIRGTEDRTNIADERDPKTGLRVYSLYTNQTMPPSDSLLRNLDVLVVDLFDIGTRTWTYVGTMLYSVRAAARRGIPVYVLDRPNPLGGRSEGLLLDAAIANPDDPTAARPGRAYALYPAPLRHGLTMGEMARWFNADLGINADLHVIPMEGWSRSMWWDDTGIPWVRPSPNIPSLTSALLYPALVPLESSNVSVGRGTLAPFQQFGAPWMNADSLVSLLNGRRLPGVEFFADEFVPGQPGDGKYAGRRVAGVRIDVVDRDQVDVARIGAAIVWALARVHPDSLTLTAQGFDLRFGGAKYRDALVKGADPDSVIAAQDASLSAWKSRVAPFLLYR